LARATTPTTSATTRSTGRPRSRRGEGGHLRAELLAAADRLLERTGDPVAVTVRGVASEVGVAPNAVYLHFADRDALLAEMAVQTFEAAVAAVGAAVASIHGPLERLRAGHAAYCRFAVERPGHYRLMFGGLLTDHAGAVAGAGAGAHGGEAQQRVADAGAAFFDVLVDACAACLDAGALDGDDPAVLASSIWALEHGWCDLQISGLGDLLPDPVAALETLLHAGR
jgi:AcrR family transcriptional regulator